MAFRNLETLESWLAEFRRSGNPLGDAARVMVQDGADGANTGLVAFRLSHAPTVVFIQPATQDGTDWVATMEPRDEDVVLDAAGLLALSVELATIAELCAFLQAKSQAYQGVDIA